MATKSTGRLDSRSSEVDSSLLIDAIYDLALDSELGDFSFAWDEFIKAAWMGAEDTDEVTHQLNEVMGHHFERALRLMEKMGRETRSEVSVSDYVNSRYAPSIELSTTGLLLEANSAADDFFQISETQPLFYDLVKRVLHSDSVEAVIESFRKVCLGKEMVAMLVLLANRSPCVFLIKRASELSSIVVDVAATQWSSSAASFLNSNYALTTQECEIVSLLYQGMSVKRIALFRERSEETVRTQISSVLKKMKCESQSQLVRLLTGLVFLSGEQEHSEWMSKDFPVQNMTLSSNRTLEFYDIGSAGATAIVIFHGIMHTPELPPRLLNALITNGFRVIGICRAGYGRSSPPQKWQNILDTTAADVNAVLSHRHISRAACLAIMGGSAFAYAFAARFPQMVSSVTAVSGVVPHMGASDFERLPVAARAMHMASKHFPKLLPLLVRSAVAIVDRGGTQKIAELVYRNSPVDLDFALDVEVLPLLDRAFRYTAYQGYSAYAYSGLAVTEDHRAVVENVVCPIELIHGVEDRVQAIESVRSFAKCYEHVNLTEISKVGQLAIFAEPERVTTLVLAALSKSAYVAAGQQMTTKM